MKFDFTTIYDRRGRDAMAVDAVEKIPVFQPNEGFDAIPMWVADMNFATAPAVTEAIRKRLEHPLFGYFMTSDEYFDSIIRWQERRNGVTGLEKEHIGYENGVLGGLMSALAAVCARGDNVLVHSPTYIGFTRSIENGGYLIDINTADARTLETLPGIGEVLAESIVAYREEHGSFASVDELDYVYGIGEGKLEPIRRFLTVEPSQAPKSCTQ